VKILAFAYACEPAEGSEPGAGWMWARMLSRYGDTWVITRANNRERIESAIGNIPERERLHLVYVDLPSWARFWKRGSRGLRLYYLLWQFAALRVGRRLHRTMVRVRARGGRCSAAVVSGLADRPQVDAFRAGPRNGQNQRQVSQSPRPDGLAAGGGHPRPEPGNGCVAAAPSTR
jgi:hypothetical protein